MITASRQETSEGCEKERRRQERLQGDSGLAEVVGEMEAGRSAVEAWLLIS